MIAHETHQMVDYLTETGKLSLDYKNILLAELELSGRALESLLLDMGILNEDELLDLLSRFRQCLAINLKDHQESVHQLHHWLPYTVWEECLAVPVAYDQGILTVAMADVGDIRAYDRLAQHLPKDCRITPVMAKKSDILMALRAIAPPPEIKTSVHYLVDDQVIHKFLHQLIVDAVNMRASDIHFEPEKFFIRVRYRCDGLLQTIRCFHESFWKPLCVQLKVLSSMDIAETRRPQDGRFSFSIMGREVDFRASSHPTLYGENIVLRILDKEKSLIPLEELGYSSHNLQLIYQLLKKPEGLVIVTGPTGSGKTTSLYSMLSVLNKDQLNIMTLEEPVEYELPHIRQSEVREGSAFHFFSGMHSILRQDPDVILIGEVRDEQTADMAIRAAMTGHMVFTTLHTVHALNTVYRLIELKVSLSIMAGILNGVIAQRLIRLLCPFCKYPQELPLESPLRAFLPSKAIIYQARGCRECSFQGYHGRKAIAEVMVIDQDLEGLILDQAPYQQIKEHLARTGFVSLKSDAMACVAKGETSLEEVQRIIGE